MSLSAREAVQKALIRYRKDGAWSDAALNGVLITAQLSRLDAALCSRIVYGVIQNTALLDYYINAYSTVASSKIEPQVRDILRLSAYQMLFMTKIPHNAAVSEAVNLVKKCANPKAAGFVNAVLRKLSQNSSALPDIKAHSVAERLSIQYSHPIWIVQTLIDRLGEGEAEKFLLEDNSFSDVTVMVNTLRSDIDSAMASLESEEALPQLHPWLENCILLQHAHNIDRLTAFKKGWVYVQDPAAAVAVNTALSTVSENATIIDGCAAPGGKSFSAAIRLQNKGIVRAFDIHENKLKRITDGTKRLGIEIIESRLGDARLEDRALFDSADVVIADVPCSGLGVIRKKPEIRYKNADDMKALPGLQYSILENLSNYVRPGGVLLYSTCTILESENESVVNAFLKEHQNFCLEKFSLPPASGIQETAMLTLWPHKHKTDGFFIAKLRRQS